MPKVILGFKAKQQEQARRQNDVIALLVRTHKGRTAVANKDLAQQLEISCASLSRYKTPEGIGSAQFDMVRRLFHAVGGTKEDWLRAGGFKL